MVSTKQSSQTARFQADPHSGAFCGDLQPFIFWISVSASLQAPERRFLASRLRIPKFRSRRLGLEPACKGQEHVEGQPAHGGRGIELLSDRDKRYAMGIEQFDQFGEVGQ